MKKYSKFIVFGLAVGFGFGAMNAFGAFAPKNKYEINEETALAVLTEILSNDPIWEKNPDVRICIRFIGSRQIDADTRIEQAIEILQNPVYGNP
jgi:hypothetical protein